VRAPHPRSADKRLFVPGKQADYPALAVLFGGTINTRNIRTHWDEILRLAASIRQGTVTTSLMLRKLGSYPLRTDLRMPYANSAGLNAPCSCSTG
jgi:TnpA family transposase